MKRFISIFLSFCLIISLSTVAFADNQFNYSNSSDLTFFTASMQFVGKLNPDGALQNLWSVSNQYLPILDQSGTPYYNATNIDRVGFYNINVQSDSSFNGYYSLYICLDFYSQTSISPNLGDIVAWAQTIGLKTSSSSTYYPVVEINQDSAHASLQYIYDFTIWLKWDLPLSSDNSLSLVQNELSQYIYLGQNDYIIFPRNISMIKYKSNSPDSNYSSSLNSIANQLISINSSLSTYLPQIIQYLDNIYDKQSDIYNLLEGDLYAFIQDIDDWIFEIYTYTTFINSTLGKLYVNLADNTNQSSLFYWLLTRTFTVNKYHDQNTATPVRPFSISGALQGIFIALNSINNYLFDEYTNRASIQQSEGYGAGSDVYDDIADNNGFAALGDFGSNAVGFGSINLIGSIFNGISSAFRWFSTTCKNNIDAVVPVRGGEDITHYYQENQDRIFEFLELETDSDG